jgi:N-acetylmuramoyl-L-alanine amidase
MTRPSSSFPSRPIASVLSVLILVCLPCLSVRSQDSSSTSKWVATAGALPFLEYGPGDDRLGGAKMTYLDSNIRMEVLDSLMNDYVVRLSNNHRAFISKSNVRPANRPRRDPYVLSGSWKVYGDERSDFVSVSLPARVPYRSVMQTDPSRIVVDLFGVTSNTNWVTHLSSAKYIDKAWYEQVEDDVMRVFIQLGGGRHWGYTVGYDSMGSRLVVRVKRPPASADVRKLRIAIDAGHGGSNSGAAGLKSRILEKDYTLLIAKRLESELKRKGNRSLFMTRSVDTTLDMPERIRMLKEWDPDVLISIHLNSSSKDSIKGTSTYHRHIGFAPLSESILKRMLELGLAEFGNVGHFNFALSGPTEYPNCLVEVAFLSNPEDEQRILDPRFHRDVARKIVEGLRDWLRRED